MGMYDLKPIEVDSLKIASYLHQWTCNSDETDYLCKGVHGPKNSVGFKPCLYLERRNVRICMRTKVAYHVQADQIFNRMQFFVGVFFRGMLFQFRNTVEVRLTYRAVVELSLKKKTK